MFVAEGYFSIVHTIPKAIVHTIEPASDALSIKGFIDKIIQ